MSFVSSIPGKVAPCDDVLILNCPSNKSFSHWYIVLTYYVTMGSAMANSVVWVLHPRTYALEDLLQPKRR